MLNTHNKAPQNNQDPSLVKQANDNNEALNTLINALWSIAPMRKITIEIDHALKCLIEDFLLSPSKKFSDLSFNLKKKFISHYLKLVDMQTAHELLVYGTYSQNDEKGLSGLFVECALEQRNPEEIFECMLKNIIDETSDHLDECFEEVAAELEMERNEEIANERGKSVWPPTYIYIDGKLELY